MQTKGYWLIIVVSWLIITFLLLIIDVWMFGPAVLRLITHPKERRKIHAVTEIDPNSEAFVCAILPQVNMIGTQTVEMAAQIQWLTRSLDKCIKRLETERGLEPLPLKVKPLFDWETHLKDYNPNRTVTISQPNEPFFVPYKIPIEHSSFTVRNDGTDIGRLRAIMSLCIFPVQNNRIENLEERLKRLDANQPLQKRLE
jgi:hypothetical protein